jgi:hypothetical protein
MFYLKLLYSSSVTLRNHFTLLLALRRDVKLSFHQQRPKIAPNGHGLLLCWYFIMSSPEPQLIEKLMMKITTKSLIELRQAGYGLIAI